MGGFEGRVALVTGAGSAEGIGFACAQSLAKVGVRIAISATTERIFARLEASFLGAKKRPLSPI